jgi:hypothetical protein
MNTRYRRHKPSNILYFQVKFVFSISFFYTYFLNIGKSKLLNAVVLLQFALQRHILQHYRLSTYVFSIVSTIAFLCTYSRVQINFGELYFSRVICPEY